jgi:hypothetical protein
VNIKAKESLMMIQKCTLFFYFLFSLLARCCSFLCSLTLPALNINNFLQNQILKAKPELQDTLTFSRARAEFNLIRVVYLDDIYKGMLTNFWKMGLLYACHVLILAMHYALFLRKREKLSISNLLMNLLGNILVPLPFQPLSSSSWKQQTVFLLVLNLVENIGLVFICLCTSSSSLDRIWVNVHLILLPIIIPNVLAIITLVVYHTYLDPWKSIEKLTSPPDLPIFDNEVIIELLRCGFIFIALFRM